MDNILTALITGGLALIGVIITNATSNRAIENSLKIAQAGYDADNNRGFTILNNWGSEEVKSSLYYISASRLRLTSTAGDGACRIYGVKI